MKWDGHRCGEGKLDGLFLLAGVSTSRGVRGKLGNF